MTQTILIDADILVYSVAHSVEVPIYVVRGGMYKRRWHAEKIAKEKGAEVFKRVNVGAVWELRRNLVARLKQIYDDIGTTQAKLFITASKLEGNYRTSLATIQPYKGNRTNDVKPYHYKTIRKILVEEYGAIMVEGQEADDQIAIEQIEAFKRHGSYDMTIIATVDKDLRQVPGQHYNLTSRKIDYITDEQALKNFYKQILIGDAVDNIPGLHRLLKVNDRQEEANQLSYSHYVKNYDIDTVDLSPEDTYNYVKKQFDKFGYRQKEIDEIGNLLWLRRYPGQIWSEDNEQT